MSVATPLPPPGPAERAGGDAAGAAVADALNAAGSTLPWAACLGPGELDDMLDGVADEDDMEIAGGE